MKGSNSTRRLVRTTVLVLVAILVLAGPVAAKPRGYLVLSVGTWNYPTDYRCVQYSVDNITWSGYPGAVTVVLGSHRVYPTREADGYEVSAAITKKDTSCARLELTTQGLGTGCWDLCSAGATTIRLYVELLDRKGNVMARVDGPNTIYVQNMCSPA